MPSKTIAHALQPGPITGGLRMKCGLKATARTSKRHVIAANAAAATCIPCAAVVRAELQVEQYERGPVQNEVQKYYEWADGPDSGLSSKTLVQILTGCSLLGTWIHSAPLDPDDFGRCHRALERFPELAGRLGEVAQASPEWTGLIEHWDVLTALWLEESPSGNAPKLYARMKELLK